MSIDWCACCGTEHAAESGCPRVSEISNSEVPVWRVAVETPRGIDGYGVLVAPMGNSWRARILTYPNVMWTVPGGGSSIKFVGRTPEEAERLAVAFIRRHCGERSYVMRDELEALPDNHAILDAGKKYPTHADPRFQRKLPVRFGEARPTIVGKTGNLSETGLFVHTRHPLVEGVLAGLLLELEHCKLPLRAQVVWQRVLPEPGREPGMGLELLKPPKIYVRYVQALG